MVDHTESTIGQTPPNRYILGTWAKDMLYWDVGRNCARQQADKYGRRKI
jgi:hypothetical protein